jgi:hypothetical protein
MSKQILKSLTMLALIVGLALAATVKSANAQITSHAVTADIPFDFIVGNKTLPAGRYTVSSATSDGEGLRIRSVDGKSAAFRLSNLVVEKSQKWNARMVFHRYGQQYFMAQVWSGDSYGRQLRPCKRERNLRQEIASNASKVDLAKDGYQLVEVVAMVR